MRVFVLVAYIETWRRDRKEGVLNPFLGVHEDAKPFAPHGFERKLELLGGMPSIEISRSAYNKMRLYVEIADKEVGWLGTAVRLPGGDFRITDVFLFQQEVTSVETEISADGLAEFATEILARGEQGTEIWNNLRFWGHSHVRMGTSPSGTDERTMATFQGAGHPWFIRGIFNKLGRAEFAIYLFDSGVRVCDAEWSIYDPMDGALRSAIEAEFVEKVKERTFGFPHQFGFSGGNSQSPFGGGLGGNEAPRKNRPTKKVGNKKKGGQG